jgi:predicted dehydrogenase
VSAPPRIALIGTGVMGRNHLRAAKTSGIPIAGITDSNPAQAEAAAAEYGVSVLTSLDDIDAAIIAVPTAAHVITALPLLQRGVHCLVEKPFAATEQECTALIESAAVNMAVLQIGHVERFNPAITALLTRGIKSADITVLTARRMGQASARVTDISVVTDLMVHDLDVVLALKPVAVTQVAAHGTRDHTEATLTFADGTIATLTASRTWPERVRDLDVRAGSSSTVVDYIAKTVATNGDVETCIGDALGAQLRHFIACIQAKHLPQVTGETALNVMKVAWRIEAALAKAAA